MKTYTEVQFNEKVVLVMEQLKSIYAKELAELEQAPNGGWSGRGFNLDRDVNQAAVENVYLDRAQEYEDGKISEEFVDIFAGGAEEIIKELYNRL